MPTVTICSITRSCGRRASWPSRVTSTWWAISTNRFSTPIDSTCPSPPCLLDTNFSCPFSVRCNLFIMSTYVVARYPTIHMHAPDETSRTRPLLINRNGQNRAEFYITLLCSWFVDGNLRCESCSHVQIFLCLYILSGGMWFVFV